jgi:hypothetical protein
MAELKTKRTRNSVEAFLRRIPDEGRRRDAFTILDLMKKATRAEPAMWGSSIVGFGSYHYKYASGHEGDSPLVSFSPRAQNFTLYILGLSRYTELLRRLGKYKTAKACLYVSKLTDVHMPTLKALIEQSVKAARQAHK